MDFDSPVQLKTSQRSFSFNAYIDRLHVDTTSLTQKDDRMTASDIVMMSMMKYS